MTGVDRMVFQRLTIGRQADSGKIRDRCHAILIEQEGKRKDLVAFGVESGGINFESPAIRVGGCDIVAL